MIYVYVRRNSDGCTRMYKAADWQPHTIDRADWTDGKYACDCQRAKFFAWAASEDEPDRPDAVGGCSCGAFSVLLMSMTNQIIYLDDDWTKAA